MPRMQAYKWNLLYIAWNLANFGFGLGLGLSNRDMD